MMGMGGFGLPAFGLSLIFSILLCVHVVRSGREMFWLWIILLFQPIGGIVYVAAVLLPEMLKGPTARKLGQATRETLDPARTYRDAQAAYALAATVQNQMRLAAAAAELGRHDEAEALYREALSGVHAEDPALLLGRARALIELDRPAEALDMLVQLEAQGAEGQTPQAVLSRARALDALGRAEEADKAYAWAAPRLPGMEGSARHAAFLARNGRDQEAREALADIDKRLANASPHYRKEGRAWRDYAAQAVGQA
jgi:hypothetical protein